MKKKIAEIERQIKSSQEILEEKKACFIELVENEINYNGFERNAINALLTMRQYKTKIENLEHILLLMKTGEKHYE